MKKIIICISVFFLINTGYAQTWSTYFGPDTLKSLDTTYAPFMFHVGTYKHKLFIYGSFVRAGNIILNHFAMWHNNIWDNAGINFNTDYNEVKVSLEHNNLFYVGGTFWVGGGGFNGIPGAFDVVYFNGSSWSKLASDSMDIDDMLWKDGNLYVCGKWYYLNGVFFGSVARWDGQQWNKLQNGFMYDNPHLYAIEEYNGKLYFAGTGISTIDGIHPVYGIASWDGSVWHSVGGGLGENVYCLWLLSKYWLIFIYTVILLPYQGQVHM
ncbi:MAG: hypothetical protein HY958_14425 [Bacteroidia bacterium]|nr:hypothetical protein [Bacteroidia bacterium]